MVNKNRKEEEIKMSNSNEILTSDDDWEEYYDQSEFREQIEGEERCKSMGMEYVSGHFRYKNGRKVAYISGHCRKRRR